ncbi:hypothetical protein OG342_34815 [Streptomyces bobili]|uniref:hypothetical protein n=1 Tax=Streptomyces bobili TaxID=67280 RepID=UPI00224EF1A2|nr:hypothetical protein [Streptomyces bobili]MCX5527970.1 hypothetical protein [Streptomyces bobili]
MNVNHVVADQVHRVRQQIHSNTHKPAKLKHCKAGSSEVPPPRSAREVSTAFSSRPDDHRHRRIASIQARPAPMSAVVGRCGRRHRPCRAVPTA